MAQAAHPLRPARPASKLEWVGGVSAVLVTALLLIGLPGLAFGGGALGPRNWLVVLFQMNSLVGSMPAEPLRVFNSLDIATLVLVGLTFLGVWPIFGHQHRIWTGIAIALPFIGVAILLITGLAGRSAVMGAGLVIAGLMFTKPRSRLLAWTGLLANALLLVGDFGTGPAPGALLAPAIALGYTLLIGWYPLIAFDLIRRTTFGRTRLLEPQ